MSKAILRDNDAMFLDLIIRRSRQIDPDCIINIVSIVHSHRVDIQTTLEFKHRIVKLIKDLHHSFGLSFKATEFIRDKNTLISFQLTDHE